jgi:hypothetical protein
MKTPSGTFALKLVVLAAGVTASIVLISACWKASFLTGGKPILVIFDADGVKTRAPSADVEKAFDDLIKKHGDKVCNVDYYKDNKKLWHKGNLSLIGGFRSEAAGSPTPADPSNLVMKVQFADLDESQQFFSTINPTPTPTPTPPPP